MLKRLFFSSILLTHELRANPNKSICGLHSGVVSTGKRKTERGNKQEAWVEHRQKEFDPPISYVVCIDQQKKEEVKRDEESSKQCRSSGKEWVDVFLRLLLYPKLSNLLVSFLKFFLPQGLCFNFFKIGWVMMSNFFLFRVIVHAFFYFRILVVICDQNPSNLVCFRWLMILKIFLWTLSNVLLIIFKNCSKLWTPCFLLLLEFQLFVNSILVISCVIFFFLTTKFRTIQKVLKKSPKFLDMWLNVEKTQT